MKRGKFIVVEGIEGAGKTSLCFFIKKILYKKGIKKIKIVREPGSTPISEKIRKIIKKDIKKEKITNFGEILLIYAARIQLMKNVIKPNLKKGTWIIGDRHNMSSLTYQTSSNKKINSFVHHISSAILKNFFPDLTIYLDIEPKIGLKRILARGKLDRIEKKPLNFFKKVRKKYLNLLKFYPKCIKVNANKKMSMVNKEVKKKISYWMYKNEF